MTEIPEGLTSANLAFSYVTRLTEVPIKCFKMETNISQTSGSLLINTEERKDLHLFTSNFSAFGGHWKLLSWHLQIGWWKMTSKWLTKFPKLNSTRAGPFSNEKEGGYESF